MDQVSGISGTHQGVLLVDDDPDDLTDLLDLLAKQLPSLTVHSRPSGKLGLDFLKSNQPAVIVTDYRMPGMDGVEFLREAKKLAPRARLIMLTGTPDLFATESGRAGSFTVLAKPVHPDLFLSLVERMARQ